MNDTHMSLFYKKIIYSMPAVSLSILLFVINLVDPGEHIASVLLVFLLIYIFLASCVFIFFYYLMSRNKNDVKNSTQKANYSLRKAYYISSIVAFGPVILLAMRTLSEVRLIDILLVGVLVALAAFYTIKRIE